MMRYFLSVIFIFVFVFQGFCQRIKTESGDISILKGEKELAVSFSYDSIKVHGYDTETEFVKVKAQLREKHEPGSGAVFEKAWFADREAFYEPLFIEDINKALPQKRHINLVKNNPKAKYNLHIETLWVYPGYNVGFSHPAKIDVALKVYEINNPENVIWQSQTPIRIQAKAAPYKRELRIGAAYKELGILMSWYFKKRLK
ncbi:hypothetical protein PK35_15750 [Tamlana nanhaiensis]|uniref:Uncharacterized protein n=1 Tax=Neotamlana nanhaiensis TaxID=1382798 RepID=A0A0D7W0D6_9FLAO|nr:hypothetical protein [Tamlana nanhaiensis]KJD31287.1 hypothetical protein PK35_15750 [Tamlana nanhaiensis]